MTERLSCVEPFASLSARAAADIRYLTYSQVENAVKDLAAQMIETLGSAQVRRLRYVGLPRGGLIVLGMLAYVLDLSPRGLLPPPSDVPLVVVDDCACSGVRFADFLRVVPNPEIIFAHLCSHPDLRAGIVRQEARVTHCIAAFDLRDLAHQRHATPAEYEAWKERWHTRGQGADYWLGLPEIVVFPWSEPDHATWNPLTEKTENTWRFAAPDRCLKNWSQLQLPPRALSHPGLRSPDEVAYSLREGKVFLCDLKTELSYGLEGVAAEMWRALAGYGDVDAAARYLAEQYEVEETTLLQDLRTFAEDLLSKGLLERVDESAVNGH